MQLMLGLERAALETFQQVIKIDGIPSGMKRQVMFEYAELLFKIAKRMPADKKNEKERAELFAKAQKATEDVLWSVDLWFGRGVVLLAHMRQVQGKTEEAQKLIDQYMPQLERIHRMLVEMTEADPDGYDFTRLSPLAECRYLKGLIMQEEADRLFAAGGGDLKAIGKLYAAALQEYVNVYARYPASTWAPESINRTELLVALLKDEFGAGTIKLNVTDEQLRKVSEKQFENARLLYNQNLFPEAVDAYLTVLNQFPETVPQSIEGISELIRSFAQIGDNAPETKDYNDLCAEALAGHLAERFASLPSAGTAGMNRAGDELRRIANFYGDRGMNELKERINGRFFELYPDHNSAAPSLMMAAEADYKAENFVAAAAKYRVLAEVHKKSPISFDAMKRLADCLNRMDEPEEERAVREEFLKRVEAREKPGNDYIVGRFMLERVKRAAATQYLKESTEAYEAARKAGMQLSAKDSGETNEMDAAYADIGKANDELRKVVAGYNEIAKILNTPAERAKYEENDDEKRRNTQIFETALYESAFVLTQISQPLERVQGFRDNAIRQYENLLKLFPKSDVAPAVMLQLGTLWATKQAKTDAERNENARKAEEYFNRLANEFPASDQAKNSRFFYGRTLIEIGALREGIAEFKKMFTESGKFSPAQILQAADYLLQAGEIDIAREGYTLAHRGAAGNQQITVPAEFGLAACLAREKKHLEAAEALDKFVNAYPTSYLIIEAYRLVASSSSLAAASTADEAARNKLYGNAVNAIRKLRQYLKTDKELFELELEVGKVLETQAESALQFGTETKWKTALGVASSHYQKLVMSLPRTDASLFGILETAFERAIALAMRMEKYSDDTPVYRGVISDCEDYFDFFGNDGYRKGTANIIMNYMVQARAQL